MSRDPPLIERLAEWKGMLVGGVFRAAVETILRFAAGPNGKRTVFLGVAAILGVYVVSLLLATGVLALSTVMRPWLAALIVPLVVAAAMAIFASLGLRRLKPQAVINVIHQFQEDVRWLRHEILGSS